MVAVLTKYESGADLMENNATDGAWKGQFRDKFEERNAQIDKIKAGINAEIALNNITQAQQAQATQYIINPITGEIVETDGSYEDELSVAGIVSLIARGASDDEIAAALDAALTSIAGKIVKDKKNAKKYLAHLLELTHVLELSHKQSGKNVELQNVLRQVQERMSKLMQNGDVKQIQEFLKGTQLRDVLTKTVQQSRQSIDALRNIQELTRNLAKQAQEANLPRELALKSLQQVSRDIVQSQLRDMVNQLRDAYTKLSKEFKQEADPSIREALKNSLKAITDQARNLQELTRQTQKPELITKQFELVQRSLQQLQAQTVQLAANRQLGQVGQQVAERLAVTQATSLQALNARLSAQRVSEGNLNIATQSGRQDVVANLRATENVLERNGNVQKPELVKPEPQTRLNPVEKGIETKHEVKTEPNKVEATQQNVQAAQKTEPIEAKTAQSNPQITNPTTVQTEARNPQNPEIKTDQKSFQQPENKVDPKQPEQKVEKAEPVDPCKGCGGGKGCCSSMGKAEANVVEPAAQVAAAQQAVQAGTKAAEQVAAQQFTNDQRADIANQATTATAQEAPSMNDFNDFMSAASQPSPSSETTATSAESASQSASVDSAPSADSSPSM